MPQEQPPDDVAAVAEGDQELSEEDVEDVEDVEEPEGRRTDDAERPPVVVRRNVAWSLPVALAASGVAIAYLSRASTTGGVLDWMFCLLMTGLAGVYLAGLVDARTPLLVADDFGVRIRLGSQWRGLPWDAVGQVVVEPRTSRFRDGRLLVVPHSLSRQLDGLDRRGRRQAALNQRAYGAAFAVPLGLVTRVSAAGEQQIADRVATLSQGRADVVTLVTESTSTDAPAPRLRLGGGFGAVATTMATTVATTMAKARRASETPEELPLPAAAEAAVPLRETRPSIRADVVASSVALAPSNDEDEPGLFLPEERELRRAGSVDLVFEPVPDSNVRPIARMGDPVEPLVIDDFETQPAIDPVIGPQLVAARHRVGLSVDELADRTRIRPHVIESIEVDDFAPCGGDVYARGHLRTIARVLGQDGDALVAQFDNRYAQAPISARRVFEAELATGMTGSMRSTVGGTNWGLLIGIVLTLVLVWGVVRLFAAEPNEMLENPPPISGAKSWPPRVYENAKPEAPAAPKRRLELVAVNASTRVQVKGPDGTVLFDQRVVLGESVTLRVPAHATVSADNAGALNVTWGKQDLGLLGEADQPAEKELGPSAE
ncbi:MAG TPA: RodZ domain-containing protein [Nocardioidaceae bacterium]|nr:RodZ domain-containing protein [Nocardioidaceae bacterium]